MLHSETLTRHPEWLWCQNQDPEMTPVYMVVGDPRDPDEALQPLGKPETHSEFGVVVRNSKVKPKALSKYDRRSSTTE